MTDYCRNCHEEIRPTEGGWMDSTTGTACEATGAPHTPGGWWEAGVGSSFGIERLRRDATDLLFALRHLAFYACAPTDPDDLTQYHASQELADFAIAKAEALVPNLPPTIEIKDLPFAWARCANPDTCPVCSR